MRARGATVMLTNTSDASSAGAISAVRLVPGRRRRCLRTELGSDDFSVHYLHPAGRDANRARVAQSGPLRRVRNATGWSSTSCPTLRPPARAPPKRASALPFPCFSIATLGTAAPSSTGGSATSGIELANTGGATARILQLRRQDSERQLRCRPGAKRSALCPWQLDHRLACGECLLAGAGDRHRSIDGRTVDAQPRSTCS